MLIEDEEDGAEDMDLVKLVKIQRDLSGMKKRDEMSKTVLAAVSALSDAVEDMAKAHKENAFYDKDLGKSINESLSKLSEAMIAMAKEKIDLTPIAKSNELLAQNSDRNYQTVSRMMLDIQQQNQDLIKAISALQQKEEPKEDKAMMAFLDAMSSNIQASNNAVMKSIKAIMDKPKEEEKAFRHEVYRNGNGRIDHVISTVVVKQLNNG